MLSEIAIKKFAIIDDITISFAPGFSVLTGETGAGKSIIIQAVNLLLGARASSDLVRTGEDTAELQAVFDIDPDSEAAAIMEDQGMDPAEGLMVRRLIASSGKGRIYINDRPSTMDLLKKVTQNLAAIAGQHAHQGLLKEENHLDILDEFAGTLSQRKEVESLYNTLTPLKQEIQNLKQALEKQDQEKEFLRFQVDEIEAAAIEPDEDTDLLNRKDRLSNAAKIFEAVNGAVHEIYDRESAIIEKLSRIRSDIDRYACADPDLSAMSQKLDSIVFELQDLVTGFRDYGAAVDLDPQSIEQVAQRLDLISKLKRKYGGSLPTLFEQYETMKQTLERGQDMEGRIRDLEARQTQVEQLIRDRARALSQKRIEAGQTLSELAAQELGALEMGNARFKVNFSTHPSDSPRDITTQNREKIFSTGMDKVQFLLSPNPGEDLKPLAKIASGGELSRIVLALKAVLSKGQSMETLIFDEVDAGIGGATSEKVGLKLKELSGRHQVICITHQAQIAGYGNFQFKISKQVSGGRTATAIVPLKSEPERIQELARMIGGADITPATLAHAGELLKERRFG